MVKLGNFPRPLVVPERKRQETHHGATEVTKQGENAKEEGESHRLPSFRFVLRDLRGSVVDFLGCAHGRKQPFDGANHPLLHPSDNPVYYCGA